MLMADAIDCASVEECVAAARKSREWAPNLCIWIVVRNGLSQYLQPQFKEVHSMQHGDKQDALYRLFTAPSMHSRDENYWRLRRKLIDAVENVNECVKEVDEALRK